MERRILVFPHRSRILPKTKSTWSEKGRTKPRVAGKTHLLVSTVKIYNNIARLYWGISDLPITNSRNHVTRKPCILKTVNDELKARSEKKGSILGPNLSLFTVSFVSSYAISHGRHSCARGKFLLALLSSHQRVKVEEDVGALRFFQLGRDLDHNRADIRIPYSLSVVPDYQI